MSYLNLTPYQIKVNEIDSKGIIIIIHHHHHYHYHHHHQH